MTQFARYAVYHTPRPGTALHRFGAQWLGWDVAAGQPAVQVEEPELDVPAITETPRKYGFHATIKPPFRLAEGTCPEGLAAALGDLARAAVPVRLEGLELAQLGRFLALVPVGDTAALNGLAAAAVSELDTFRAPPTEAELARRRKARLTPAQDANLVRWGYPFVMDAFRFHMTLTGRLDDPGPVHAALAPRIAALGLVPYTLDSLTLCGEDAEGRFHEITRFGLGA